MSLFFCFSRKMKLWRCCSLLLLLTSPLLLWWLCWDCRRQMLILSLLFWTIIEGLEWIWSWFIHEYAIHYILTCEITLFLVCASVHMFNFPFYGPWWVTCGNCSFFSSNARKQVSKGVDKGMIYSHAHIISLSAWLTIMNSLFVVLTKRILIFRRLKKKLYLLFFSPCYSRVESRKNWVPHFFPFLIRQNDVHYIYPTNWNPIIIVMRTHW